MALTAKSKLRALAILSPPGGRPKAAPSAANAEAWRPSPAAVKSVVAALSDLGIDAKASPGGSLELSATVKTLESVFGVTLEESARGGVVVSGGGADLPLDKLPAALREKLEAVGFEQAPDFGPGGSF